MSDKGETEYLLDVPLVVNPTDKDCGAASLMMALQFFKKSARIEKIIARTEREQNEFVWTVGLVKAAAESGLNVEFFSKSINFNPELLLIPYYQTSLDGKKPTETEQKIKKLIEKCKKHPKVKLIEKTISLNYIISKISDKSIPVVLLDWSIISGQGTYQGHFVPIVGYSETSIIVHDSGPANSRKNHHINKKIFETARKTQGTDEDILFLSI